MILGSPEFNCSTLRKYGKASKSYLIVKKKLIIIIFRNSIDNKKVPDNLQNLGSVLGIRSYKEEFIIKVIVDLNN